MSAEDERDLDDGGEPSDAAEGHGSTRAPIENFADALLLSYRAQRSTRHIDAGPLPSRYEAIELLELIRELLFPGYYSARRLNWHNIRGHVVRLLADLRHRLEQQVTVALCAVPSSEEDERAPRARATALVESFLAYLPELRERLALDVHAARAGDPAVGSTQEIIFCYPGIDAIFTYRVAHLLHTLGVPLLPRILSEYVHNETGIDIHPGAKIGRSFFIDHGTGLVIGATAQIGDRVRLYQGVTLGALTVPRTGDPKRGAKLKRHPTLEDDVTVYANATILGGETVIGRGSVIGGSVFLTHSVPPGHMVSARAPELSLRSVVADETGT